MLISSGRGRFTGCVFDSNIVSVSCFCAPLERGQSSFDIVVSFMCMFFQGVSRVMCMNDDVKGWPDVGAVGAIDVTLDCST